MSGERYGNAKSVMKSSNSQIMSGEFNNQNIDSNKSQIFQLLIVKQTQKVKKNPTSNGRYSFIINVTIFTVAFIGLSIATFRLGSNSNDQQTQMYFLSQQLEEVKQHVLHIQQKYEVDYVQQLEKVIQKIELEFKNKSNEIKSLQDEMSKVENSIQLLKSEFSSNQIAISLKDNQVSDQILSLREQATKMNAQVENNQKEYTQNQIVINQKEKQDSDELLSLNKLAVIAATHIQQIQNDVLKSFEYINANSESLNEQKISITQIKQDISLLKEGSSQLQSQVTAVQLFYPKIEGLNLQIENIQSNLGQIHSQQTNLQQMVISLTNQTSNYIESQIAQMKNQIANFQSSIDASGMFGSIESYGPYVAATPIQSMYLYYYSFTYFQTTESCIITTKGNAVITLIATGFGLCYDCHGQIVFLKNKKSILTNAGINNQLNGASFIYSYNWVPINHTQIFFVEKGTYEFQLGVNLANGGIHVADLQSVSFIATVTYYS